MTAAAAQQTLEGTAPAARTATLTAVAWAASRGFAIVVAAAAVASPGGWLQSWNNWDVRWFSAIARYGYRSPLPGGEYATGKLAYFPGMPAAMRVAHVVVHNWTAAGLLVSVAAGAVAAIAMYRLALPLGSAVSARRSVVYLAVFPFTVFLVAGYSEALFLALATTAWLALRQGQYLRAGVLSSLAVVTRISGLALLFAFFVEMIVITTRESSLRVLLRAPWSLLARGRHWLLLPYVSLACWIGYQHSITGMWNTYTALESQHWSRHVAMPWTSVMVSIHAWRHMPFEYAFPYAFDLLSVAVGVVATVALVRRKLWGWAAYVGFGAGVLLLSAPIGSAARAVLLWFPLFVLLGQATARRRALHVGLIVAFLPFAILNTLIFTTGAWVD